MRANKITEWFHNLKHVTDTAALLDRKDRELAALERGVHALRLDHDSLIDRLRRLEDRVEFTDKELEAAGVNHLTLSGSVAELENTVEGIQSELNDLDIPKADDIIGDDEVEEWIKNAVGLAVEDLTIRLEVC